MDLKRISSAVMKAIKSMTAFIAGLVDVLVYDQVYNYFRRHEIKNLDAPKKFRFFRCRREDSGIYSPK